VFINKSVDTKAEAKKSVYEIAEKLHRSPWDEPHIVVFGKDPPYRFGPWFTGTEAEIIPFPIGFPIGRSTGKQVSLRKFKEFRRLNR
jgi:hypothetical protein